MDARATSDAAARLDAVVVDARGRLSVASRTVDGWQWGHDADRVVPAASTIKLPVFLAALAAVEAGCLDITLPVDVPSHRVGGSGALSLLPSVTSLPLRELLALMICLSDNDATNVVVDLVGVDAVAKPAGAGAHPAYPVAAQDDGRRGRHSGSAERDVCRGPRGDDGRAA